MCVHGSVCVIPGLIGFELFVELRERGRRRDIAIDVSL